MNEVTSYQEKPIVGYGSISREDNKCLVDPNNSNPIIVYEPDKSDKPNGDNTQIIPDQIIETICTMVGNINSIADVNSLGDPNINSSGDPNKISRSESVDSFNSDDSIDYHMYCSVS